MQANSYILQHFLQKNHSPSLHASSPDLRLMHWFDLFLLVLIGLKVSLEVYLCAIAESFCSCGIFRADTPFDFAQGSELVELQVCPYICSVIARYAPRRCIPRSPFGRRSNPSLLKDTDCGFFYFKNSKEETIWLNSFSSSSGEMIPGSFKYSL